MEIAVGLTSQTPAQASPQQVLQANRGQWTIGNGCHYVIDWNFDEDRCRIRPAWQKARCHSSAVSHRLCSSKPWLVLCEVIAVHSIRQIIKDGVYDTANADHILRGGGPADYFTLSPDQLFKMARPV